MALRRGRDDEAPFEIIGKVGEQPLEVVLALCRPGEQPRFVIGEGIYGALAAFEDRCAIVKKGPMTSWMSGARGEGLQATYRYAEIGGIRFVASTFTGVLEIVPADDDDPDGELLRGHGDPQKRADAIQLSKDLYEKAYARLDWLRDQIRDARRAADPSIEPAEQLKRMRAAVDDDPYAYGLEDPEPFVTAIDDALAALGGRSAAAARHRDRRARRDRHPAHRLLRRHRPARRAGGHLRRAVGRRPGDRLGRRR